MDYDKLMYHLKEGTKLYGLDRVSLNVYKDVVLVKVIKESYICGKLQHQNSTFNAIHNVVKIFVQFSLGTNTAPFEIEGLFETKAEVIIAIRERCVVKSDDFEKFIARIEAL
jgi:hypothetical protein